jgi:hypothetical protein
MCREQVLLKRWYLCTSRKIVILTPMAERTMNLNSVISFSFSNGSFVPMDNPNKICNTYYIWLFVREVGSSQYKKSQTILTGVRARDRERWKALFKPFTPIGRRGTAK